MEMQKKQKTPDIPLLWDVRRKILNVLPPNFRNIILLCRNAVSLFPNTPDFHRIYSYPDNVGHTATVTTKFFGFPVLLTNPFTIPLPYQDSTIGGTNRTALIKIMPAKNASKPNGLLIICFRNSTGSSDLQLKPCHKRDIQSVANAIVMPR